MTYEETIRGQMNEHVANLRWLGNLLDADAADQGIGQCS
jgi:hypothetical protein